MRGRILRLALHGEAELDGGLRRVCQPATDFAASARLGFPPRWASSAIGAMRHGGTEQYDGDESSVILISIARSRSRENCYRLLTCRHRMALKFFCNFKRLSTCSIASIHWMFACIAANFSGDTGASYFGLACPGRPVVALIAEAPAALAGSGLFGVCGLRGGLFQNGDDAVTLHRPDGVTERRSCRADVRWQLQDTVTGHRPDGAGLLHRHLRLSQPACDLHARAC